MELGTFDRIGYPFSMLLGLVAILAVGAPPAFELPPLEQFDGKAWAGIQVGVTTDSELKKLYKTDKGAFRPEAIVLDKGELGSTRVEAVMLGRGAGAKVQGFRLSWKPVESLDRITRGLPSAPLLLYPRERYEDWAIAAYPDRGIALFVTHTERNPDVEAAVLCTPDALRFALRGYDDRKSEITEYRDPYEGKPKVMEFGSTSVKFNVTGIQILDQRADRDDLTHMLERVRGGGTMRYRPGATGSVQLTVTCPYDATRGGRVTVSAHAQGSTNYGRFSADAADSMDLGKNQSTLRYLSLANSVVRDLEDKVQETVSKQGPPPVESFRYAAWANVTEVACPRK